MHPLLSFFALTILLGLGPSMPLATSFAANMAPLQSPYPSYNSDPLPPSLVGMGSSAAELAALITLGWNMGNTLEATGGETAWGNPVITDDLIRLIKESGFDAIRLPVSWNQYADQDTAEIDPAWLDRIKEVVQLCLHHDLITKINIHWDGGWLENNVTPAMQEQNNAKQRAFWEQIATHLRDFDGRLIFASANEPHVENATQMEVLMSYHQTFIDAVRSTGGRNAFRVLAVQGPLTDIERTYQLMDRMPDDTVPGRLMAEIHYYTPYNFALMPNDENWGNMFYYWGDGFHSPTDTSRNATWGEEDLLDELFGLMKEQFVDQGIPVILGEYSAMRRSNLPEEARALHLASRAYYHQYVTQQANAMGLIPFYWDNGGANNHASGIFNRHDRTLFDQQTMDALILGATEPTYWASLESTPHHASANPDGDWANNLFELFLGSDPSDAKSGPRQPTLHVDEQGRLVLSIHRFARVEATLEMLYSTDLENWEPISFEVQQDSDTLLDLVSEDSYTDPGAHFVTLRVSASL